MVKKNNQVKSKYPLAIDPQKVGAYPALAYSGEGYFYDDVLEYRVWVHLASGDDVTYRAFPTYEKANEFSRKNQPDAEPPLVLVLQREYIHEPSPSRFIHIKESRLTEWRVDWLKGHKRGPNSIDEFLKSHAQAVN